MFQVSVSKEYIQIYFNYLCTYNLYIPMHNVLVRAYPLQWQVGGDWALEIESFLVPVKWHQADMRVPFVAQKTRPSNGYARIQNIMHGAV
jgi:hypothetical protein